MLTINDLVARSNRAAPAFDFIWDANSSLNSIFRAVSNQSSGAQIPTNVNFTALPHVCRVSEVSPSYTCACGPKGQRKLMMRHAVCARHTRQPLPGDMNHRWGPRMAVTARQFSKRHCHSSGGHSCATMRLCRILDRIKRCLMTG